MERQPTGRSDGPVLQTPLNHQPCHDAWNEAPSVPGPAKKIHHLHSNTSWLKTRGASASYRGTWVLGQPAASSSRGGPTRVEWGLRAVCETTFWTAATRTPPWSHPVTHQLRSLTSEHLFFSVNAANSESKTLPSLNPGSFARPLKATSYKTHPRSQHSSTYDWKRHFTFLERQFIISLDHDVLNCSNSRQTSSSHQHVDGDGYLLPASRQSLPCS